MAASSPTADRPTGGRVALRAAVVFVGLVVLAVVVASLRLLFVFETAPLILAIMAGISAAPFLLVAVVLGSVVPRGTLPLGLVALAYLGASLGFGLYRAAQINLTQNIGQSPAFQDGVPTALGLLYVGTAPAILSIILFLALRFFVRT